jgi:hypothetical protein
MKVAVSTARRWAGCAMNTLEIQSLGVTQEGAPTRWRATEYVDGLGWLEVWGTSLVTAMEALRQLAAQRVAEASEVVAEEDHTP